MKKAGDVADECCADLTGLHWLRKAKLPAPNDWLNYGKALANFRLSAFQQDPKEYDIAAELDAALALPAFPSLPDIRAFTFEWAINVAKTSPLLDKGVLSMFNNLLLPPTMSSPAQERPLRRFSWGGLFGRE